MILEVARRRVGANILDEPTPDVGERLRIRHGVVRAHERRAAARRSVERAECVRAAMAVGCSPWHGLASERERVDESGTRRTEQGRGAPAHVVHAAREDGEVEALPVVSGPNQRPRRAL